MNFARRIPSRSERHHCHTDFVFKAGIVNALTGVNEIIDIIKRIKVADGSSAVFFKQFGVRFDNIRRLAIQSYYVYTARQRL